jgi:hypothetical protein
MSTATYPETRRLAIFAAPDDASYTLSIDVTGQDVSVGDVIPPSPVGAHDGGVVVGFREEVRTFHRITPARYYDTATRAGLVLAALATLSD